MEFPDKPFTFCRSCFQPAVLMWSCGKWETYKCTACKEWQRLSTLVRAPRKFIDMVKITRKEDNEDSRS